MAPQARQGKASCPWPAVLAVQCMCLQHNIVPRHCRASTTSAEVGPEQTSCFVAGVTGRGALIACAGLCDSGGRYGVCSLGAVASRQLVMARHAKNFPIFLLPCCSLLLV